MGFVKTQKNVQVSIVQLMFYCTLARNGKQLLFLIENREESDIQRY